MKCLWLTLIVCFCSRGSSFSPLTDAQLFQARSTRVLPLSEFYKDLDAHRLKKIIVNPALDEAVVVESDETLPRLSLNPILAPKIIESAIKERVEVILLPSNGILSTVGSILQIALYIPLAFFALSLGRSVMMLRRPSSGNGGGGIGGMMLPGMGIEESEVQNITFADWAGSPEVLNECREVVTFLNNADNYTAMGASLPRGILLEGPPGTGKTLLAKAIAGEGNTSFISMAGSEFVQMFAGLGAFRVRQLFEEARRRKPCILFVDEIDAVGRKRSTSMSLGGGNDEREQTLNQILSEMDGFADNDGMVVIAATNRRDVLDDALLRPGRFDRLIYVPLPDAPSRLKILETHAKNKPIQLSPAEWRALSEQTEGFSGADLKNLLNEAAILSVRKNRSSISFATIGEAVEKLLVGIRKEVDSRSESTRRRVALHEAGHALLCQSFPEYFVLQKVSIQETYSGAGGYTVYTPLPETTDLPTRDMLKKRLRILLGGRAAESLVYGDDHVSTGASEDLRQANDLCRQLIGTYGLGKDLENIVHRPEDHRASESLVASIDAEVQILVQEAYQETRRILQLNSHLLHRMANQLLSKRILTGEDLKKYILEK